MKRKYLILVGVGIFSVLCILWLTVEDKLKEYFILDNQQNRDDVMFQIRLKLSKHE